MRSLQAVLALGVLGCFLLLAADASAQQATISTPFHSVNEGFFEHMGTSWGLSGPNWYFSFGGSPTQAAPQFGGFDPTAGANSGFSRRSGGINGYFAGNFSQGNRRSMVSQVPSVTVTNGVPGYVGDTSVSPFVIGYVPIVGSFPRVGFPGPVPPAMVPTPGASSAGHDAVVRALQRARAAEAQRERMEDASVAEAEAARMARPAEPNMPPPQARDDLVLTAPDPQPRQAAETPPDEPTRKLAAARTSSAGRPAPSVAEARRLHAAEQAAKNEEALKFIELARNAEANGKPSVAKVYYQNAAGRALGELRDEILARIRALDCPLESR
jgi:hypothetical protein